MLTLRDVALGQQMTLTGVVRAVDMTNGRDADDPEWALLPVGKVRVTLLVDVEPLAPVTEEVERG